MVVRSLSISMRLKQCATLAPVSRGDDGGEQLSDLPKTPPLFKAGSEVWADSG